MEWISVKDRLPEKGKQVLLFNRTEDSFNYSGFRLGHLTIEPAYTTGRKHIVHHPEKKYFVVQDFDCGLNSFISLKEDAYWMELPKEPLETSKE
jgi:hypothetical protein